MKKLIEKLKDIKIKATAYPWHAIEAKHDIKNSFNYWLHSPKYGAVGYWTGHKSNHEDARWLLTKEDADIVAASPELLECLIKMVVATKSCDGSKKSKQKILEAEEISLKAIAKAIGLEAL